MIGAEFIRSEAGRDASALFNLAMEWQAGFLTKGWTR
jgi:hypothetical protein